MKLHEKQREIVRDTHRFKVICAGRRFGKTILSIEEMLFTAVTTKNARVAYIAPTYQQARDIAWEQLKARVVDLKADVNESRLEIEVPNKFNGTSKIFLRSWDNVETLRGQAFHLIILDEVASMKNFSTGWNEVLRPALTDHEGRAMFISTPKGFNHFYDLFGMEAKDEDYKSFNFKTSDNPHIPPKEIDKARAELTEDRFAQEYEADFRKTEGLVYKEFTRVAHTYKELPPNTQIVKRFGGHDFGTNNPCASITILKDKDARYYVSDEWYKKGMTDAQQADYVSALKWEECFPDPASASGILEMRNRGINVREVIKNADSVRNGIATVIELLKTGRLKIHESCVNLIWEFETYAYPEKKQDRNENENPIKENDHALDALRYALTMDNAYSARQYHPHSFEAPKQKSNIAL